MPIPPLALASRGSAERPAAPTRPFMVDALVLRVYPSGVLALKLSTGEEVDAYQHTDEPLEAGQGVLASRTETAWTVHGRA